MKKCNDCAHAQWKRTESGKLHPSGDGKCTFEWKLPAIPACMFWMSIPKPYGGLINRRQELKDHCVYWARKESA